MAAAQESQEGDLRCAGGRSEATAVARREGLRIRMQEQGSLPNISAARTQKARRPRPDSVDPDSQADEANGSGEAEQKYAASP